MTEQETRTTMKEHRWSYLPRTRKGHNYVYAQQKALGKKREKYICAYTALTRMSVEQLVAKLTGIVAESNVGTFNATS